jgi:DNA ligase (NAD+)
MNLFNFDNTAADQTTTLVQEANAAYDEGNPILKDQEFDLLENNGLDLDPRNFRKKVDHPFIMGSLDKIKSIEDLVRWMPTAHPSFALMPKLDGLSLRLRYEEGFLTLAVTRGNGTTGSDVTANVLHTNVRKKLPRRVTLDVRVEGVIRKEHASKFDKNLRNVAAGMIGAKEPRPELALIDCVVIDIVTGEPMSWEDKQALMDELFPENLVVTKMTVDSQVDQFEYSNLFSWAEEMKVKWDVTLPYALDGVVLYTFPLTSSPLPIQTTKYPADKVSLKFGSLETESSIQNIEWTLGQHGKLTPVLNIAPVELDGTTVSRVSASNYALLKAAGMGIGAKVMVTKSGDIIPYITKVLEPSTQDLDQPVCPVCGQPSVLSDTGVDALCKNDQCEGQSLVRLQKTFALFEIDFISDATIEALCGAGHDTLEKIFSLSVSDIESLQGFGNKSATYIVDSLKNAKLTEAKVIKSAFLKGIGERKGTALLNHYGTIDEMVCSVMLAGLEKIEGFGPNQTKLIEENIEVIANQLVRFQLLGVDIIPHEKPDSSSVAHVVCCTGTCEMYARKELAQVLEQRGFKTVSSVTKETTLLLCADPQGNSSKLKKARSQGIPIQSYEEFFATENSQ